MFPRTAPRRLTRWFLLGAAVLAQPFASATDVFRLDRIAVVRFSDLGNGNLRLQHAVLHATGELNLRSGYEFAKPADTPPWVLDRNLVTSALWTGFHELGGESLRNFMLTDGGVHIRFNNEDYHFVTVDPDNPPANGRMINLSTRARLTRSGSPVIGGLVVEQAPRLVLVRAVGPTLRNFGVNDAAANPRLRVVNNATGEQIHVNDDWHQGDRAAEMREIATRIGAFPLDEGSTDAGLLIALDPGSYSFVVESAAGSTGDGTVLLEVYNVPS